MKNLIIIILCLGCLSGLMAQNIWKPIGMNGEFLGVSADGSVFSNWGYSGLHRSQDEGATWELNYDLSYVNSHHFIINDNNRIFVFNENSHKLCYSDDNGDTWQEQASGISTNWVEGMYSLSNDTIVMTNHNKFFWTLNGGESWNETNISFLQDMVFTSILADHAGNVYISITNAVPIYELGIYTANFNDIENWTWLLDGGAMIYHMELDPEGNVVAGGYGQFQQQPGLYLVPDWRFTVADNGIVYDLHDVGDDGYDYTVLRYSADHGETFYEYGEALPLYSPVPGGLGDGSLYKGRDGHLYFSGHDAFKKSVFNTNEIHYIEGEVVISETVQCITQPYPEWLAIRTADNRDYCVMVDGFRPNPTKMDELIVRYDTIPVGSVIGAFGTIKEMEYDLDNEYDMDNGATSSFTVIDVHQTTAHYYDAITAMLDPGDDKVKFQLPNPPYTTYYITINGEKQDWPLVFNGVTYNDTDLHTFIGHCEVMLDYYANPFNGMELQDIQPFRNYTFQMEGGTLSTIWDPLCLTLPCEDQHFLFVRWGDFIIPTPDYLMHNGRLFKDTYINNDVFREGMYVAVKGIQHFRYDIYGDEVNVVELVEMDAEEETTMIGVVERAPMPYTSFIPLPGLELAFVANGKTYYLDNEQSYDEDWFLVGNDTIHIGQEITATFTAKLKVDNSLNFYNLIHINSVEPVHEIFPQGTEWYYEIKYLSGDVTYQHLEYAADTAINSKRVKIITETNTMYDKSEWTTHEYIYEDGDLIYWWNKGLEDFTLLYDFGAEVGDEWEIKVGMGEITVHVDAVQYVTYNGQTYKMLSVSDPDNFFSGDILCGIGHLKSFFPEGFIPLGKDYEVDGLRCFWQDGDLVLNLGEENCDAVYNEIHGVDENDVAPIMVYPNPTDGHLFVITNAIKPLSPLHLEYRITNLWGQTLLTGTLNTPTIDVSSLSNGFYFLKINDSTIKFIVK